MKKFVLIDAVKSTAAIYLGEGDDKSFRLDTPRRVPLRLKHTFTDKGGKRKITRYKDGTDSIFQDIQIKDGLIPANEKFTDHERVALQVVNGVLIADDDFLEKFLHEDNNPQRLEFTGKDRGGTTPVIMELDEAKIVKEENEFIFKTAEAIMKIRKMNLDQTAAAIALFRGASFPVPESIGERHNILTKDLEGSEERVNAILDGKWDIDGEEMTIDEEMTILLGKAINQGIISMDLKPDYVQIKKEEQWVDAKQVVADTYEQKETLFKQFLASSEGELLRKDIESMVKPEETKKEVKK